MGGCGLRRPGCPSVCLSCPFLPSSSEDVCLSLRGVICTPCFLIFKNGFIGVTLYTPYSFPIKVYHSVDVKLFPDVCTRTAVGWRTFPRPPPNDTNPNPNPNDTPYRDPSPTHHLHLPFNHEPPFCLHRFASGGHFIPAKAQDPLFICGNTEKS